MPLALRHRDDHVTPLAPLDRLSVVRCDSAESMAMLQLRPESEIIARFDAGHRAYVASHAGVPAAWGWVATRHAKIGELDAAFAVPQGERYLWNFVTLATHRGLGIYPRLLDAIVRAESSEAEAFWVAHAPENHASEAGIRKAGFITVADLSFDDDGRPAVHLRAHRGRPSSLALGLPESDHTLAPCWRCARAGMGRTTCLAGECRCDYQVPHSGCAA